MTRPRVELLVLDVHGVVLNNPFREFLRTLAGRTEQAPEALLARWDAELRLAAWTGALDDVQLWRALVGAYAGPPPAEGWQALLEAHYALGPAAPRLDTWIAAAPIWLLSNHRRRWLMPRLARLGLAGVFARVLVSDDAAAVKPAPESFTPVLQAVSDPARVLYVDDQARNVEAAAALGLRALHLTAGGAALDEVDRLLIDRADARASGDARVPTL